MVITPEQVLDSLRPVVDPELNLSIVDLGLVRGIEVQEETGDVQVQLTLTSPMCPLGPEIIAAALRAVQTVAGAGKARVELVWSPPWDPHIDASEEAKAEMGIWD
jgi:metal-sulfur cluster biosynthetic enzyme